MIQRTLILIVAVMTILSCEDRRPSGVLSESQMENLLFDYHMAQSMAESTSGDIAANRYLYVQAVLQKHRVSEAEFDSSMVYWCAHSEKLRLIYKRINDRVQARANAEGVNAEISNTYANLSADGDTANIWNMSPECIIVNNVRDNHFTFSMAADSTFRPGDTFLWSLKPLFLSKNGMSEAYADLVVEYSNDSVVGTTQRINGSYIVELHIRKDKRRENWSARRISGTVYVPVNDPANINILALSQIALVRYHHYQTAEDTTNVQKSADVISATQQDSMDNKVHIRTAPHDVRNSDDHQKTINIIRNLPLKSKGNKPQTKRRF